MTSYRKILLLKGWVGVMLILCHFTSCETWISLDFSRQRSPNRPLVLNNEWHYWIVIEYCFVIYIEYFFGHIHYWYWWLNNIFCHYCYWILNIVTGYWKRIYKMDRCPRRRLRKTKRSVGTAQSLKGLFWVFLTKSSCHITVGSGDRGCLVFAKF